MRTRIPAYTYLILGGFIVLVLGGLTGWYFYLHTQNQAIETESAASGANSAAPSFGQPTGSTQTNQAIATQSYDQNQANASAASSSALWEIDRAPVAGMGFVITGQTEDIYYVERANGYIFDAQPDERSITRLTDTLMPKIYRAEIARNGSLLEQSIDAGGDIATFLGIIASSTNDTGTTSLNNSNMSHPLLSVTGNYIDPNIRALAFDPSTRAIFYTLDDADGGVDGFSMQWGSAKKKQVFTSPLRSWIPMLTSNDTIVLTLAPADGVPGFAYSLRSDGTLNPLVRNIPGLTFLPYGSGSSYIFGASSGSGLVLNAAATSSTYTLSIATTADKCVWMPGESLIAYCAVPNSAVTGDYLDARAKGFDHTSDDWWRVDLMAGQATRIYSPSADNASIDVEHPIIDPSGTYIIFRNATDQSLWLLRVAQ